MTNVRTSHTGTAERVCVGAVVVPSCGVAREAGAYRPLMASDVLAPIATLGLLALLGGLMRPSSAVPGARRMGGLQGIPVH